MGHLVSGVEDLRLGKQLEHSPDEFVVSLLELVLHEHIDVTQFVFWRSLPIDLGDQLLQNGGLLVQSLDDFLQQSLSFLVLTFLVFHLLNLLQQLPQILLSDDVAVQGVQSELFVDLQ